MKINEFKKALYKALELKIYIDKNDFGDLQNKNMLNKDLGGALSDVINVLNDEINKMKKENKMNKDIKIIIDGYEFLIVWVEHKEEYHILHNNGLGEGNGYVRFLSNNTYKDMNKIFRDLDYITDNTNTYILSK